VGVLRTIVIASVLGACAGTGSSADDVAALAGCPTPTDTFPDDCRTAVDEGTSCEFAADGNALAGSCQCSGSGFWVCNSCPFYWTPLDGCTPDTTCEINSWEHGCSCGCSADGEWACSPDTINSRCP
jgi:hypothetical protein